MRRRIGPDGDANLGPNQKHVLLVLGTRGASAATDWAAWYPLSCDQARSAILSLAQRGLVDVAGFDGRSRTYELTRSGDVAASSIATEEEGS